MKFSVCLILAVCGMLALRDVTAASVLRLRPTDFIPNRMFASFRTRRMPEHSVSDYYGQLPINGVMPALPVMTSHTAGTVLSTDYLNQLPLEECSTCGGEYGLFGTDNYNTQTQEETNKDVPEEVTGSSIVTSSEPTLFTVQKSKTEIIKGKQKPTPAAPIDKEDDDDEEEEENNWPFVNGDSKRKVPSYNVFFPMMFGYPGSFGRAGNEDAGGFSGTSAIANSFSTGKGGVATSHATAFGSPSSHKNSNWKRKSQTED